MPRRELPPVLRRAMSQLVLTQDFWASIVYELQFVEVEDPPAMLAPFVGKFRAATDGEKLYYSRSFVESLTPAVATFVLAHEAAHCMLLHLDRIYDGNYTGKSIKDALGRRLHKDPAIWNTAGDYVINAMLKDSGFTLWKDCLYDVRYTGKTTEQVYKELLQNAKKCPSCGGSGKSKSGKGKCPSCAGGGKQPSSGRGAVDSATGGDLAMPPSDTDHKQRAEDWKDKIVRAATIAKARGTLPGSIEDLIKEITEPQYPVWFLLEQYVESSIKAAKDSSWKNPDRNMWPYGIVMPGDYSEVVPHVFLWYDTSGSVSNHELSRFHTIGGDIIRNLGPERLSIGQCDAAVTSVIDIEKEGDWPDGIECTGRGGTSFRPPFTWMEERGIVPSVMIYLTDLMGDFPAYPPPFPVLWVSTVPNSNGPFGETIHLPAGEE